MMSLSSMAKVAQQLLIASQSLVESPFGDIQAGQHHMNLRLLLGRRPCIIGLSRQLIHQFIRLERRLIKLRFGKIYMKALQENLLGVITNYQFDSLQWNNPLSYEVDQPQILVRFVNLHRVEEPDHLSFSRNDAADVLNTDQQPLLRSERTADRFFRQRGQRSIA